MKYCEGNSKWEFSKLFANISVIGIQVSSAFLKVYFKQFCFYERSILVSVLLTKRNPKRIFVFFFFFLKKGENRLSFAGSHYGGFAHSEWEWRPQALSPGTTLSLSAPGCHTLTCVCEHPLYLSFCVSLSKTYPKVMTSLLYSLSVH